MRYTSTRAFHFHDLDISLSNTLKFSKDRHIFNRILYKKVMKAPENFKFVPSFTLENEKNGAYTACYVPFSTFTVKNVTDWKMNHERDRV